MSKIFYFGEKVVGYDIPVLNEREARAGAGILLLPAITSFLISFLTHDFTFTKIFVTFFMLDFFIRIFINPQYAPTLILGRFFVRNQTPEYVGAKQKKFAWSIGFYLSVVMFLLIVVFEIMSPVKIIICLLCIILLFSETAFGICLGCIVYHKLQSDNSSLYCPGDICKIKRKEKIQHISKVQLLSLVLSIFFIFFISKYLNNATLPMDHEMKCEAGKCGSGM